MKQSVYALCLSLGLGLMAQTSHTAVVKNTHSAVKADNDLKMMTSIKAAPTQNFFASQNQRFSRFVQSFFSSNQS